MSTVAGEEVRLFAYGTLLPRRMSRGASKIWSADAVRGRLYDLGDYPGLVDLDHPSAGWVEGFTRRVTREVLESQIDSYEGVAEGLFRRVHAVSRTGLSVWVYVYNRPLEVGARGPLSAWDGRRGFWPTP